MKPLVCIAIFLMTLAPFSSNAKERQDSYNMQRAFECVHENDFDKAMVYAQRELSDNPKNAKAYDLMGYLYGRNDEYGKPSDFRSSKRYTDANGNINTAKTVNLAKIKIGDLEVNNIRAGIVPNQKAPLLLGQQVFNKFGKVEIDHTLNLLRITVIK